MNIAHNDIAAHTANSLRNILQMRDFLLSAGSSIDQIKAAWKVELAKLEKRGHPKGESALTKYSASVAALRQAISQH